MLVGLLDHPEVSGGSHLIQAPTNFGTHIMDNECVVVNAGFGRDVFLTLRSVAPGHFH